MLAAAGPVFWSRGSDDDDIMTTYLDSFEKVWGEAR
jgi:hypothetical protein